MNIPTPFARRKKPTEPPAPDTAMDLTIPFGVHPLVDYIRFQLMLMENQSELAEVVQSMHRTFCRMRNGLILSSAACLVFSIALLIQLWANLR